jgi:hypothetical protein
MKSVRLLATALLLAPGLLAAQAPRVELVPYVGYNTSSSLSSAVGRIDLENNLVYGGQLGFLVGTGRRAFINYSYWPTSPVLTDRLPIAPDTTLGDIDQHNIMFGGEQDLKQGNVVPYASGALGLVVFDSKVRGATGSSTRFSANFAFGFKAMSASQRVGLRIQGKVAFNSVGGSGSFWCGSYGCGGAVTTSGVVQFEPSAGLVLAF